MELDIQEKEEEKKIPHKAVITIKCEIMELLRSGEVSGRPKKVERKFHFINGDSLEDVTKKVEQFYREVFKWEN